MNEGKQQSILGFFSVLLAMIAWIVVATTFLILAYYETFIPGGVDSLEKDVFSDTLLAVFFFSSLPMALISLLLGIAGIVQKKKSRLFGIAGFCLALLFGLCVLAFAIIGHTIGFD